MEEFRRLYGEENSRTATLNLRKAVSVYCAVAVAFAAFCAVFVALYITVELNVIVCFLLNFLATAGFCWYSLIFFKFRFSALKENVRFYRSLDNARITFARGTFAGTEKGEKNIILRFETDNGTRGFSVKPCISVGLSEGAIYDLQTVGENLIAYREAENV